MKPTRVVTLVVALAAVLVYGARAVSGVSAGIALARARLLVFEERDREALPLFERAEVGFVRLQALEEAGDARLRLWDARLLERPDATAELDLLEAAATDYLEYLMAAPASWIAWEGMARAYYRAEEAPVITGEAPLDPTAADEPWAGVGRAGRIAIGMLRRAIESAPRWYSSWDGLAIRLGRYGLQEEALEAVRESARVLPLFQHHHYRLMPDIPPPLLDAFAEGARDPVDGAPLLTETDRLIGLARLEERRGNHPEAERVLRRALVADGADDLNRADASYLLGGVLRAMGRHAEAREAFERAGRHPVFEAAALAALAGMAREMDEPEEALELLRRLRWSDPTNLAYCLEFAELARRVENWPAAVEALRWASLLHPQDDRPRLALVETHLERGDIAAATSILRELRLAGTTGDEIDRLAARVATATGDGPAPRDTGGTP